MIFSVCAIGQGQKVAVIVVAVTGVVGAGAHTDQQPIGIVGIVGDVGSIVTGAVTWLTSFAGAITANPIVEFFVIMAAVGLGVGLLRRLISVN